MNCCNDFGECTNGHNCAARNAPTLREQVEADLGVKPAKVGNRTPAWFINQAPSHWRKTLKYWAAMALGFVLGSITAGVLAVFVGMVK